MCFEQFCPNNCKPFCPFFMQHSSAAIFWPLPPCCLENCFKSHSVCFRKICKDKLSLIEEIRCCYRKIANNLYFGLRLSMLWISFPLCRLYQRKWLWVREVKNIVKNMPVFYIQQKCQDNYMKTNSAQCLHLQL